MQTQTNVTSSLAVQSLTVQYLLSTRQPHATVARQNQSSVYIVSTTISSRAPLLKVRSGAEAFLENESGCRQHVIGYTVLS